MRSFFQFITTPTADTPGTTLLLHFDTKRYIFGSAAEGTQRAAVQQGTRLLKVSEIFLTGRTEWSNLGGLIGVFLTLADSAASSAASMKEELRMKIVNRIRQQEKTRPEDARVQDELDSTFKNTRPKLTLFGARNLNYMLATARRFLFRQSLPVDAREVSRIDATAMDVDAGSLPEPIFRDENIKVWAISITPDAGAAAESPTSIGTKSPRKRSFGQMHGVEATSSADSAALPGVDGSDEVADLSKRLVSDMFDSDWRRDALFEVPLKDVKMPASVFVRDPRTGRLEKYHGPVPGGKAPLPKIKVLVRRPWPGVRVESLPAGQPAKESVSYIVRNHPQRGKFNPDRARALGLNDKSLYSTITKGGSLVNDKGETITADMVLEKGRDGGGAAIIDLPSIEYVEPFLRRPEWKNKEQMLGVGAFIWILGPGVVESPALKAFMEQNIQYQHVISSTDVCPNRLALDSAAGATIRLDKIDPGRYVVPYFDNTPPSQLAAPFHVADRGHTVHISPEIEVKPEDGQTLLDREIVESGVAPSVLQLAASAHEELEKDVTALEAWANTLPQRDVEIFTLGTGSASPSKYRNVSATLVRVPGWGSVLLDCGENTLGQLKRVFPPVEFDKMIQDLRMIWISHMHADHHLGTASLIRTWYQAVHNSQPSSDPSLTGAGVNMSKLFTDQKRLAVVSDPQMAHWLWEYSQIEDYGFSRIAPLTISPAIPAQHTPSSLSWFLPPIATNIDPLSAFQSAPEKSSRRTVPASLLGLSDIQSVLVNHCAGARAVSITFPSTFKLSYSGDCRPSGAFVKIGRNSTVCIHEATFDDELKGDAEAKNHSTTSQALSIAAQMNAQSVVLTHFSQRYQKVPVLEYVDSNGPSTAEDEAPDATTTSLEDPDPDYDQQDPADEPAPAPRPSSALSSTNPEKNKATVKLRRSSAAMKVCVAFDYMRVRVDDIARMEQFTPALLELFADEKRKTEAKREANIRAAEEERESRGKGQSEKGKEGREGKEEKKKSTRNN